MFHLLSFGQGNMASYAAQISREDRWKVILYVRELQAQEARKAEQQATTSASAAASPPPPSGAAEGEPGRTN